LDVTQAYREHAAYVWRLLGRLGIPPSAAEDLLHDVFVIATRKQDDYDPSVSVAAWLCGIARRVAANHRRKSMRRSAAGATIPRAGPASAPQEMATEHRRLAILVDEFVEQLPSDKRIVFELVDIEGLSCREAADALSIPLPQIYARLRTARRRFEAFASTLRPAAETTR
jgi:RNA polymerase sigma-70 factor (ECF subfamily)